MTNVGFATLDVIPSFTGFQRHLERGTTPGLLAAGRTGGARFGDVAGRSAGQRFGSVFRTAAKAGLFGTLAVAAGAIKLGSDAIGEAREAQKVARQTRAVIKSTGGAAKISAKDVGRLATNLSKMAGIDDEVIQGGENVLLTFKNIRNEQGKGNKIFDKATKASLDLSVALKKDLGSASLQVGKALNDPVAGMTALSRAGVQFTDDQKETIKSLVESGDKLGAQKIILKELTEEFGGAAKSQASSSDRLKVAFDNVKESLGTALLPVMQDFSRFLLRKGIPAAQEFVDWFTKEGIPGIKDLGRKLKPLADELLPAAATGFKSIRNFASDALPFAEGIVGAFNNLPPWVKKVLIAGTAGGLAAKKLGITKALGGSLFTRGATPVNPLFVSDVSGGLGGGGGVGGKSLRNKALSAGGKAGILGAFGVVTAIEARESGKMIAEGFNKWVVFGDRGRPGGGASPSHPVSRSFSEQFGGTDALNEDLKRTNRLFVATKAEAEEFGETVRSRIPRTIHITVTGWDVADRQARAYLATLLEIRGAHVTSGFSPDGTTSGTPGAPNHTSGRTLQPATRGVNINVEKVVAQDVNGLLRDLQNRAHRTSSDGVGG